MLAKSRVIYHGGLSGSDAHLIAEPGPGVHIAGKYLSVHLIQGGAFMGCTEGLP
jgi:hypothetical protein